MILYIALILFFGTTQAAEYAKDQGNAYHVLNNGNINGSLDCVGYGIKTNLFEDVDKNVQLSRISLFSPGLYKIGKQDERGFSFADNFHCIYERNKQGWLPGDFFIFDSECSGKGFFNLGKSLSYGQHKDAFAFIYTLNKLYDHGIKEFTMHAQCYGTRRVEEALYYLSDNQQNQRVEDFFLAS